jgi:serine protease AprX
MRIVASNSFGIQTGTAPTPDPNSDFLPALDDAVAAGIVVVFSAGNYHGLAGGQPTACSPNSIWLHKSRADILAVATCRLDKTMWDYSSRGPSQHFGSPNTSAKPDVTAPTPRNGRILYGSGESVMANGWGTSGACPQVAGLAALLISADSRLSRTDGFRKIRNSAQTLGFAAECQGSGLIDCAASFATA